MRYYFLIFVAVTLVLSTSINAKTVLLSNKTKFVSMLDSQLGNYKLISGNDDICTSGELSWLDTNDPELGFKLGEGIIFNNLHNGTQTNKVENFCLVTTKFKFTTLGITMSLRHNRCEDVTNRLESTQILNFYPPTDTGPPTQTTKLIYKIENSNVHCKFELQE